MENLNLKQIQENIKKANRFTKMKVKYATSVTDGEKLKYFDLETGKNISGETAKDYYFVSLYYYSDHKVADLQYFDSLGLLRFRIFAIHRKTSEPEFEKREESVYYLTSDKRLFTKKGQQVKLPELVGAYSTIKFKSMTGYINYISSLYGFKSVIAQEEVKRFCPKEKFLTSSGTVLDCQNSMYDVEKYLALKTYKSATKVRTPKKEENHFFELQCKNQEELNLPVNGITYTVNYTASSYNYNIADCGYIENFDNGDTIIRIFNQRSQYSQEDRKYNRYLTEDYRIYIPSSFKSNAVLYRKSQDTWKKVKYTEITTYAKYYIANPSESSKSIRLKGLQQCFEVFKKDNQKVCNGEDLYWCQLLFRALNNPILEQFVKVFDSHICNKIIRANNFKSTFNSYFGNLNKTSSLLKALGLSKQQVKYINENWKKFIDYTTINKKPLKVMKELLGKENSLAYLTVEDFAKNFDSLHFMLGRYDFRDMITNYDGTIINKELTFKLLRVLNKIKNKAVFGDGYIMHQKLRGNFTIDYDWENIKNDEDALRYHDILVASYNAQLEEERRVRALAKEERLKVLQKESEEMDKKRKKFNFENDDFIIRLPKTLGEISAEGLNLHHCVGGYVSSHATGNTTILFLRKKSEPDQSFYTIELHIEQMKIVQIHGVNNRWLGNNPEAIPFVKAWLKDKGISCTKQILGCTATGYSPTGEILDVDNL